MNSEYSLHLNGDPPATQARTPRTTRGCKTQLAGASSAARAVNRWTARRDLVLHNKGGWFQGFQGFQALLVFSQQSHSD